MQALAEFLAKSVVTHPDAVRLTAVEGSASLLLELRVHPDDAARLQADRGGLLRAIQVVLNAASGPQKAVLDLVAEDARASGDEE